MSRWTRRSLLAVQKTAGLASGLALLLTLGAGTALVGSHAEVAEKLVEYSQLGIDHFILSGYPHLEEAYWFGEGVLPLLERTGLWTHPNRQWHPAPATPFAAASAQ